MCRVCAAPFPTLPAMDLWVKGGSIILKRHIIVWQLFQLASTLDLSGEKTAPARHCKSSGAAAAAALHKYSQVAHPPLQYGLHELNGAGSSNTSQDPRPSKHSRAQQGRTLVAASSLRPLSASVISRPGGGSGTLMSR